MATVANKITMQVLPSVNTPDYENNPDWAINPDLSSVEGVPKKYWKYDRGFKEMTPPEKRAVDDADALERQEREVSEWDAGTRRRFILVLIDELNRFRSRLSMQSVDVGDLKEQMRTK